jgi:hypothetical protein
MHVMQALLSRNELLHCNSILMGSVNDLMMQASMCQVLQTGLTFAISIVRRLPSLERAHKS